MIIKDFKIDESHPGEMLISAKVLIKREGKWYEVLFRRTIKDFNHKNFITTEAGKLRDRLDAIRSVLKEIDKIDKHHIPAKKGQFIDSDGNDFMDEEFTW